MRKSLPFCLIALCLVTVSCKSEQQKKTENSKDNPEAVKMFSAKFARFAAENNTDSLTAMYPDMTPADSVRLIYQSDSISVTPETRDSTFLVKLAKGVTLNVRINPNGKINVTDSHGLFHFNNEKMNIAKKTGMYDPSLSDLALAKRFKDEDFFKYIAQKKKKSTKILSIGKYDYENGELTPIINNTDQRINANDYLVQMTDKDAILGDGEYMDDMIKGWKKKKYTKKGKTIPPHGKVYYQCNTGRISSTRVTGIILKIPQDELERRFFTFTGKEYQDYLNSMK